MDFLFLLGGEIMKKDTLNDKIKKSKKGKLSIDQEELAGTIELILKGVKRTDGSKPILMTISPSPGKRLLYADYLEQNVEDVDIVKTKLNELYGVTDLPKEGTSIVVNVGLGKDRKPKSELGKEKLKFREIVESKGGVIPTEIQEAGTTIIFNRALKDDKDFPTKESILKDKDTRLPLERVFGRYKDRLPDWTHTYFEQKSAWLQKYKSSKWDEFEYGNKSFVQYFKDIRKEINLKFKPLTPAGRYETWNPSDIFAVYDKNAVTKILDEEYRKNEGMKTLIELNNILTNLFAKRKLVGISLKKISSSKGASLEFVNLNAATLKKAKIEKYKMKDIDFKIDNIFTDTLITNSIKYGSGGEYSINILKAGSRGNRTNLSFNTAIKATPGAQGGQAPIEYVLKRMTNNGKKKITFTNDNKDYPSTNAELFKNKTKIKTWYNVVKPYFKNFKNKKDDDFITYIGGLMIHDETRFIAQSKLMTLNFFFDAIKNYETDADFWTDLLYLGMKVGKKFAPHAKIS